MSTRRLTVRFAASVTAPVVGALLAGTLATTGAAGASGAAAPSGGVALTAATTSASAVQAQSLRARAVRHISYRHWSSPRSLRHGQRAGVVVNRAGLRIGRPVGSRPCA